MDSVALTLHLQMMITDFIKTLFLNMENLMGKKKKRKSHVTLIK